MLFVCLSHFAGTYLYQTGAIGIAANLAVVGMIASPTFVTVSGLVAGFLSVTNVRDFPHLRRKLIDRGVFLIIVGHLVLSFTDLPTGAGFPHAYRIGFITDALGIAVIIGPWFVTKLRATQRVEIALTLFALNWVAVLMWNPNGPALNLVKHYLIGVINPAERGLPFPVYPVVPWFCVYLVGTVLGQAVGRTYLRNDRAAGNRLLLRVGWIAFLSATAVRIATLVIRRDFPAIAPAHANLLRFLSAYQKFPPGPVYLIFYGGAGILLVAGVLELERHGAMSSLVEELRQLGQASLFVYVLQFYLFAVVLRELRLPYTPFWPLLFILSIVMLARAAAWWNSRAGNRYLTVGITRLLERNARKHVKVLSSA